MLLSLPVAGLYDALFFLLICDDKQLRSLGWGTRDIQHLPIYEVKRLGVLRRSRWLRWRRKALWGADVVTNCLFESLAFLCVYFQRWRHGCFWSCCSTQVWITFHLIDIAPSFWNKPERGKEMTQHLAANLKTKMVRSAFTLHTRRYNDTHV